MAFLEDAAAAVVEGGAATGIAVGAAVLFLVPGLLPAVGRALRTLAIGAVKTGAILYRETAKATEDLVAEARAELTMENLAARNGTTPPSGSPPAQAVVSPPGARR